MTNPESHCRIGKIKSHGGAEIHLINTVRPEQKIVDMLEDELRKAKAGETRAFGFISVTRDGWSDNAFHIGEGVHDFMLAGTCERLKHRIVMVDP